MKSTVRGRLIACCAAAALTATSPAHAGEASKKPYRLAQDAGCMVCHEAESPARGGESLLPLAPSFTDIARHYGKDPHAAEKLVTIVRDGSGPLRRDRHWDGKASFDRMYPNDLGVSEEEARTIVEWILTLGPAQPARRDRAQRH